MQAEFETILEKALDAAVDIADNRFSADTQNDVKALRDAILVANQAFENLLTPPKVAEIAEILRGGGQMTSLLSYDCRKTAWHPFFSQTDSPPPPSIKIEEKRKGAGGVTSPGLSYPSRPLPAKPWPPTRPFSSTSGQDHPARGAVVLSATPRAERCKKRGGKT